MAEQIGLALIKMPNGRALLATHRGRTAAHRSRLRLLESVAEVLMPGVPVDYIS